MRTQRLAFSQLQEELEVLGQGNLRGIKGGLADTQTQWEYAIDPQGNVYWRVSGDETWIPFNSLNEVEIVSHKKSTNWGNYISTNPFNIDNYGGGGGAGGAGGAGGGGATHSNRTLAASGQSGMTALDIINTMFTALGIAATHAQASAIALQLESSLLGFTHSAQLFGVWDFSSNLMELFDSEATWQDRLEDGSQMAAGIGLTFAMTNPAGLVIGGLILASWEIYEYQRDNSGPVK